MIAARVSRAAGRVALPRVSWGLRASRGPRGRARGRGRAFRRLLPRPRARTWLALAAVVALLAGGYLWLRDSSLASVKQVTITGVDSREGAAIRQALRSAALDMTTLHVRTDALRSAVSPFPVVKNITAQGDWPHRLRIEVIEYHPVAVLVSGDRRLPVSSDGVLLRGELAAGSLPTIPVALTPGGGRVRRGATLDAIRVLAAAPGALRPLISGIRTTRGGFRVRMRNGPQVVFGAPTDAAAKWAAATRVLADPTAKGARYVDVRIPSRPVAGSFPQDSSGDQATTAIAGAAVAPETSAAPSTASPAPSGATSTSSSPGVTAYPGGAATP